MILESARVLKVEDCAETTSINFFTDNKSIVNHVWKHVLFVFEFKGNFLFKS